ncbi:hypothetical protein FCIRC_13953 [Fusarium circinatum]|uniref:Uncharacterized protein n=1 Tax=Fusarium circinatum TaxID=48490 RepID=A0A8H5SND2_FUSCI|nr:hypothetical protein FCIRC_13953 [Fusarium circinatum]
MPAHPGLPLSHIQAALSILQTCPRREFSNPIMQQLASRTAFALTLSCGATETPIPEALIRLYNDLNSYMSGPLWILVGLTMRLVDFHAAARAGKFSLSYILEHARAFREELSQAQSNIPRSWGPRRIDTNDTLAFGGYYNVYARHELCQILNSYRVLRLGVCAILLKFPNSSGVTEELAQVTQEICATVPQFVLPQARPQNTFPLSPLQILECSGLLTPLYAAAQNTQDPVMHAWILRTVIYMADNGVKGARTVAGIMTSSPDLHQWKVCSMVGNYAVFA